MRDWCVYAAAVTLVAAAAVGLAPSIAMELRQAIDEDHAAFAALELAIMEEEGFRAYPYRDTDGGVTIGFGTNFAQGITRHEAQYLMRGRLVAHIRGLEKAWPVFVEQPVNVQAALADMAYQLGVGGVLQFRDMLACLEAGDVQCAHDAALDSLWSDETPDRAARVTDRMIGR